MSEIKVKPIYTLTTTEYSELIKKLVLDTVESILDKRENQRFNKKEKKSDIIFVDEVLELTGYRKATLYSKVCRFEIPVLSRRKPLTFSRKEITDWIHNGKPDVFESKAEQHLIKLNQTNKRQ